MQFNTLIMTYKRNQGNNPIYYPSKRIKYPAINLPEEDKDLCFEQLLLEDADLKKKTKTEADTNGKEKYF